MIARHMHSTFEFHFIVSGACKVIHDGGEFDVSAGEFYLTAPSVYHEQRDLNCQACIEYSINCDLALTDDSPSEAMRLVTCFSESPCKPFKDSSGIIRLFNRALSEAYYCKPGFYNNVKCLAAMILTASARSMSPGSSSQYRYPARLHKDDYRLVRIKRFIEDNIFNPISVKDIASYMYLSDKQVCRIIKENRGMSTKEFIMKLKLQKAKELLKESSLPVKQISQSLGFSSEYYFSQFFKREEGYPPGDFRKNVQNV